jgi:hypothetical protein
MAWRLAALEWGYLGLLDGHGAWPRTLHEILRTVPRFFADLLVLPFRSRGETGEPAQPPAAIRNERSQSGMSLTRD